MTLRCNIITFVSGMMYCFGGLRDFLVGEFNEIFRSCSAYNGEPPLGPGNGGKSFDEACESDLVDNFRLAVFTTLVN